MNVDFKYITLYLEELKKVEGEGCKMMMASFWVEKVLHCIIFYSKGRGGGKFSIIDYSGVIFFSKN